MADLQDFTTDFYKYVESQNLGDKDPSYVYKYDLTVKESPMDELLALYLLSLEDIMKSKAPPPPIPPTPVIARDNNGSLVLSPRTLAQLVDRVNERARAFTSDEIADITQEALALITIHDIDNTEAGNSVNPNDSPAFSIGDPITGTTSLVKQPSDSSAVYGTDQSDTIIGSPSGGSELFGYAGSDIFVLSSPSFTKSSPYMLRDFDPSKGDRILMALTSSEEYSLSPLDWSVKTINRRFSSRFKRHKRSYYTFLYNKREGYLYYNYNLMSKGLGKPTGGLVAILPSKTPFSIDYIDSLSAAETILPS